MQEEKLESLQSYYMDTIDKEYCRVVVEMKLTIVERDSLLEKWKSASVKI